VPYKSLPQFGEDANEPLEIVGASMHLWTSRARPISVTKSARSDLKACLVATCLLLFGCSGPPTVLLDTPTGVVPLSSPAPVTSGGLAAPPPGLEPASPPPAQGVSRDGGYTGTATVLDTAGGLCTDTLKVSGFAVRGNSARFGGFRGTIGPDGGLQMVYGQDWIIGQFEGATFHGQLSTMGRFDSPGCTYMLNLERIGA
jgi:hypothetical protein